MELCGVRALIKRKKYNIYDALVQNGLMYGAVEALCIEIQNKE